MGCEGGSRLEMANFVAVITTSSTLPPSVTDSVQEARLLCFTPSSASYDICWFIAVMSCPGIYDTPSRSPKVLFNF